MNPKKTLIALVLVLVLCVSGYVWYRLASGKLRAAVDQAGKLISEKNYAEAARLLEAAAASPLSSKFRADILYGLSQAHLGASDYAKAAPVLEELRALPVPELQDFASVSLARALKAQGNEDQARKLFDEIATRPQDSAYKAAALLGLAQMNYDKGLYLEAYKQVKTIIDQYPNTPDMESVMDLYGNVNMKLLFAKTETPDCEFVIVQPGDTLPGIAAKYGMTADLLSEMNGIKRGMIRPGNRMKVLKGTFSVMVDKSLNILTLRLNGNFFKRYHVGTGKLNSTPVGEFEVTNKLKEPVWYKPDGGVAAFGTPENLLGTRWMGISYPGYGIHGTWERDTIGKQSSAGCIRLLNEEVEELYMILPEKTKVTIVD